MVVARDRPRLYDDGLGSGTTGMVQEWFRKPQRHHETVSEGPLRDEEEQG